MVPAGGGKVYLCSECGFIAKDRSQKSRHKKSAHGTENQPKIECPICKAKFTRRDNMLAHVRKVHQLLHYFDAAK